MTKPFNAKDTPRTMPSHSAQLPGSKARPDSGFGARSLKPPAAPPVYRPVLQRKVAQPKPAVVKSVVTSSSVKQPVAPPVYRPQPVPRVLQTKSSLPNSHTSQAPRQPIAPAVYRPQAKKIVQAKANSPQRQSPSAPPVYRPQAKPVRAPVHHPPSKPAGLSVQLKPQPGATPGVARLSAPVTAGRSHIRLIAGGVIQRMEVTPTVTEWRCANCGFTTFDNNIPDYQCPRCRSNDWRLASDFTENNNNNEIVITPKKEEEEDYEFALMERCLALQGNELYVIRVRVATKLGRKALFAPSSWGPLKTRLLALIQLFADGNKLPSGERVHLSGGLDLKKEKHKLVWRQIGSALLGIVKFVEGLLTDEEYGGFVQCLYASGFMDELFGYIAQPTCNENGAARLKKALELIQFTLK